MAAYDNTFAGASSTDLSAQTSDSGHTHTKQDTGSLLLDGGGNLYGSPDSSVGFYTADYTPSDADDELEFTLRTGSIIPNLTIGMGVRCETDGDGVFVFVDGFADLFKLVKTVGGSETQLDTAAVSTSTLYTIRIVPAGGNVQWLINAADQGTHSLGGDLSATGLIGFIKFDGTSTAGDRARIESATVTEVAASGPSQRFLWDPRF